MVLVKGHVPLLALKEFWLPSKDAPAAEQNQQQAKKVGACQDKCNLGAKNRINDRHKPKMLFKLINLVKI